MSRPKKRDLQRKTHVIPVRLDDVQYEIIVKNSERAGLSMADYIRQQAVHGKTDVHYQVVVDLPDLKELVREFSAIGNNLNQIARYFNMGGNRSRSVQEDINGCIEQIMEMREIIMEMAGELHGNTKTHRK